MSKRGAGQATYDEQNTDGGIIMMQLNMKAYPETWQIWATDKVPLGTPSR
jgi:hypothetical protein